MVLWIDWEVFLCIGGGGRLTGFVNCGLTLTEAMFSLRVSVPAAVRWLQLKSPEGSTGLVAQNAHSHGRQFVSAGWQALLWLSTWLTVLTAWFPVPRDVKSARFLMTQVSEVLGHLPLLCSTGQQVTVVNPDSREGKLGSSCWLKSSMCIQVGKNLRGTTLETTLPHHYSNQLHYALDG